MIRMSVPTSNRWVAKLWPSVSGRCACRRPGPPWRRWIELPRADRLHCMLSWEQPAVAMHHARVVEVGRDASRISHQCPAAFDRPRRGFTR